MEQNVEANSVAQNSSGYQHGGMDTIVEVVDIEVDAWRKEIFTYLQDP
jgi:hypothetical protein